MSKLLNRPINFSSCIFPFLVLISGVLAYRNILFSTGPSFQNNDIEVIYFPKYYFIRQAFMRGELPFWDPYTMLGQPLSFSLGMGMLYPFLLLFLSLRFLGPLLPRHLELFIVGHLLMSGLTMYWSTRKIGLSRLGACIAGIIFQMAIINKELIYAPAHSFSLPYVPLAVASGIILFRSKRSVLSLVIAVASLSLILSTTCFQITIYIFLTLGLIMCFFIIEKIRERDWIGSIMVFKKAVLTLLPPSLITLFITLPGYIILLDSIRYNAPVKKFGPLYIAHVWTLFFPGFATSVEASYAYAGVITILLAIYFCITKGITANKDNGAIGGFLFVMLAIFWFYYSVENSILEKGFSYFPILKTLRMPQFGLIMYVYVISILAGKGLERFSNYHEYKIRLNKNYLFPVFIIFMLISSMSSFILMLRRGFYIGSLVPILFGYIFILFLIYKFLIRSDLLRSFFVWIIPFIVLFEILGSSPPFIQRSDAEALLPYKYKLDKFTNDFPEAFLHKDLYRIENFNDYVIANYYFDRFGTYGYFAQGIHPARYHYLWNRFAKTGPRYEKYCVHGRWAMPISLDSRLYDLAGVKYFYLPEYEWIFVDYKKAGKGEWVEVKLEKDILVFGISIYNPPSISGGLDLYNKRRILKARIVLNEQKELIVDIPDEEGWHKFYFEPVKLHRLKIIADEVSSYDIAEVSRGVVIGEIELLDKKGNKIDIQANNPDFNASSSMTVSKPEMIIDGRPGYVWESMCSVLAEETLPSSTLERLREGCYINKNVFPRAFIVHGYRYFKDIKSLAMELHSDSFTPSEEILLEGDPINFNVPSGPYSDKVEITNYRLNDVEISVENDKAGFLILSDMYSPGWEVFVDGKKDRLLISDGLFRGVFLREGEHKVVFKYTPPLLKLGLVISLTALVLFVVILYRNIPL